MTRLVKYQKNSHTPCRRYVAGLESAQSSILW